MWYKSLENVLVIVLLEYRFSLEEKSYLPTTSSVKYLTTNSLFCSNPAQSMTDSKQTAKGLIHLFPSVCFQGRDMHGVLSVFNTTGAESGNSAPHSVF